MRRVVVGRVNREGEEPMAGGGEASRQRDEESWKSRLENAGSKRTGEVHRGGFSRGGHRGG